MYIYIADGYRSSDGDDSFSSGDDNSVLAAFKTEDAANAFVESEALVFANVTEVELIDK